MFLIACRFFLVFIGANDLLSACTPYVDCLHKLIIIMQLKCLDLLPEFPVGGDNVLFFYCRRS